MYNLNELNVGRKVEVDDLPWVIVDADFVKPGKGQAFTKYKIKSLIDGRVIERTCKSGDTVKKADVMDTDMQFLYNDGEFYHFMDPESFEQVALGDKQVGETKLWLKENETYNVTLWNGKAIAVEPPSSVILTITQCDPGIKGDTVSGATKPATLETGAVVKVPLFVEEGDSIKVNTKTGEYTSRA